MKNCNYNKFKFFIYLSIVIFLTQIFILFPDAQYLTPKLTENEVRAVIPILKAEINSYKQYEDAQKADYLSRKKLLEEIKSGKIDPLDWLKQHSKYVIVPPDVVYEKDISRALSIKGWDLHGEQETTYRPYVLPTALFTFGKELPAINKHLLGKNVTNESYNAFTSNPWNGNHPSFQEIWKIHKDMTSFYKQKGFSVTHSMDGFSLSFMPADTDEEIAGSVDPIAFEIFNPLYPDLVKNSRSHPMGPSIAIWATDKLMEKVFKPLDIKLGPENGDVKTYLKKSSITEERYGELKGALLIARIGSQNPEEEEPSLDITPTTPEEREMVKTVEKMREEVRIKKNNIQIYRKYKEELDPILEVLSQYIGGKY